MSQSPPNSAGRRRRLASRGVYVNVQDRSKVKTPLSSCDMIRKARLGEERARRQVGDEVGDRVLVERLPLQREHVARSRLMLVSQSRSGSALLTSSMTRTGPYWFCLSCSMTSILCLSSAFFFLNASTSAMIGLSRSYSRWFVGDLGLDRGQRGGRASSTCRPTKASPATIRPEEDVVVEVGGTERDQRRARDLLGARFDEEVDLDHGHQSPAVRSAMPTATAIAGAWRLSHSGGNWLSEYVISRNGFITSTRAPRRSSQDAVEVEHLARAAGQRDLLDVVVAGGRVEELERLLQLGGEVLAHAVEHAEDRLRGVVAELLAGLHRLRLLARQVQLALDRLGVGVAAEDDVAPEHRLPARQDVHVHDVRADVDERQHLVAAARRSCTRRRSGARRRPRRRAPGPCRAA